MKSLVQSIVGAFWRARLSFLGQGFSFIAMLLPVFFGLFEELRFLVIVSAFATVAAHVGTWSISNTFPSLSDQHEADIALVSSSLSITSLCVIALMMLAILPLPSEAFSIALWSTLTAAAQGLFIIVSAVAVRAQDYRAISVMRLLFGTISFSAVLAACVLGGNAHVLVIVSILSNLASALAGAWIKRRDWMPSFARGVSGPSSDWGRYLVRYASVNAGNLAALLAFLGANLAPLSLDRFANAWAVVVRIVGGLGTLAHYVVAPLYEIRFSRGIREQDFVSAVSAFRQALAMGVVCGVPTLAGVFGALWFGNLATALPVQDRIILVLASFFYVSALALISMISRNLTLAGGRRNFLAWAVAKASVGSLALLFLTGAPLLIVLGTSEAVFDLTYVWLTWKQVSRRPDGSAIGQPQGS